MSGPSSIEWTDATWNPVRGCSRVSEGCRNCYAERMAARFSDDGFRFHGIAEQTKAGARWTGKVELIPSALDWPLRKRKPLRIFVNSMSDLFHERLSDEDIAAVFGVMAACPQHVFQVLTKRPERMQKFLTELGVAGLVEKFRVMALAGRIEEYFAPERTAEVAGWPGYFVTSYGRILSDRTKHGERGDERHEIQPMAGETGHSRVMLYRGDGQPERLLVHRLVLDAFDRLGSDQEQGRHLDGNPRNNMLANLRWGSQSENWDDSKRHGTRRRYYKLSPEQVAQIRERSAAGESGEALGRAFGVSATQIRNITSGKQWTPEYKPTWPLPQVWLGVSVENQATADERIPLLLQCPAAVRFVSYEPALGPVNLRPALRPSLPVDPALAPRDWDAFSWPEWVPPGVRDAVEAFWSPTFNRGPAAYLRDALLQGAPPLFGIASLRRIQTAESRVSGRFVHAWNNVGWIVDEHGVGAPGSFTGSGVYTAVLEAGRGLDWVIVGGESGPGARPFDLAWARSAVEQCKAAGVACFYKQGGTSNACEHDRKGGHFDCFPSDLKIREFPRA